MIDLNELFTTEDRLFIGNVLSQFGERLYSKSLSCFLSVLDSEPDSIQALCHAACLAMKIKDLVGAQEWSGKALELSPDNPEVLDTAALVALSSAKFKASEELFHRCIAADSSNTQHLCNYAYLLIVLGREEEALKIYNMAQSVNVLDLSARFQRSLCMMTLAKTPQEWKDALHEYEIRQLMGGRVEVPQGLPIYTGNEVGDTLVICAEQGLGDCIMMARYARYLKQHGEFKKVYLYCKEPWVELMSRVDGFDAVISHGTQIEFSPSTYYIPAFSLLRVDGYPQKQASNKPYLMPFPRHVDEIKLNRKPRVGLCWSGNPLHGNDKYRSIGPDLFSDTFADMSGDIDFYALQQDWDNRFRPEFTIDCHITTPEKLANVISSMDMVVTVDTAVGHIAGAMGVPSQTILPSNPDWRWTNTGHQTTWYPSVTLFRAQEPMEWKPVLLQVKSSLAYRVQL